MSLLVTAGRKLDLNSPGRWCILIYPSGSVTPLSDLFQNAGEQVIDSVNSKGTNVSYEAFSTIFSEILPQDRDLRTFLFVMHLCSLLIWKLGFSFGSYLKRFLSEQFTEEAVSIYVVYIKVSDGKLQSRSEKAEWRKIRSYFI